jgi:hypothetical protein
MEKFLKIPDMPAAAAWKFLKISLRRRRRGCIYFLSAAAAQKFLKLSPSRRRRLYFFGKNRRRRRLSRSAYTSIHQYLQNLRTQSENKEQLTVVAISVEWNSYIEIILTR